jgi:hypothetical protein
LRDGENAAVMDWGWLDDRLSVKDSVRRQILWGLSNFADLSMKKRVNVLPALLSGRNLFLTLAWSFPENLSKDSGSLDDQNLGLLSECLIDSLRLSFPFQLPLSNYSLSLTTLDMALLCSALPPRYPRDFSRFWRSKRRSSPACILLEQSFKTETFETGRQFGAF